MTPRLSDALAALVVAVGAGLALYGTIGPTAPDGGAIAGGLVSFGLGVGALLWRSS